MTYLIKEICEFVNGGAWSDKEYSTSGIPVLKVSNLQSGGIDFSKIDFIPEQSRTKYSKHLLKKDDLVIATVGSHPGLVNSAAGRATIISANGDGYLLNQNAVCLRTKDPDILAQKYLAFIGKTESFQHYIQQRGKGAANQMRIAIGAIKEYELDLPTIDLQRRIASILSAYDDLIENNLERIKLLEELAQRTYEECFVKFRVNGEDLAIDEETGLPVGWERVPCIEAMDVLSGGTPKTTTSEYWKGDIEFFTPKDASRFSYTNGTEKKITSLGLKTCNSKLYPVDTVFITARGTVGKLNLASKPMAMNQSCYALRGKDYISQIFLFNSLLESIEKFKSAANGGVFDTIVVDTFRHLTIVKPTKAAVDSFTLKIQPAYDIIKNLLAQNRSLKEARDILLPRLMDGTISIAAHETNQARKIIQLEAPTQKQAAPQFKEAILISLLTYKFGSEKYPLGRMRYTKLSYLFHRHADNQIKDYLRKAAGPYNPKTKYGGPEKIAHDNDYVIDRKNGQLTGFIAGPNIEEARLYFEKYWNIEYLTWLEAQFKYRSNDDLELFATVDNSLIELNKKNEPFTVEAVKNILKKEPEWTAKLEREIFNDLNILRAVTYLPTIFQY
jgi:type I restriction enzyme S subunit